MTTTPTIEQLTHAVKIAEQIAALQAEMAAIFGNHPTPAVKSTPAQAAKAPGRKKGKMSAAGRAAIAAAQKARWAKIKAPAKPSAAAPKKSGMSPAHRAKLAAAARRRWARIRAGKAANPFDSKKK